VRARAARRVEQGATEGRNDSMTLRISGKDFDIGEALRSSVQARIQAAMDKYFDGGFSGHVTFERDGSGYRVECALHLSSGITLQTEGKAHAVHVCFDQAADRLEKRLRRYKRRLKDHHPGIETGESSAPSIAASYVIQAPDETTEDDEFSPVTIAESTSRLRRMSVSAAILDLDLTGVPVVVFRHAGHGRINVVYRRSDGNIGWIDPEAAAG
jgi:ribosomal subunit interface protein